MYAPFKTIFSPENFDPLACLAKFKAADQKYLLGAQFRTPIGAELTYSEGTFAAPTIGPQPSTIHAIAHTPQRVESFFTDATEAILSPHPLLCAYLQSLDIFDLLKTYDSSQHTASLHSCLSLKLPLSSRLSIFGSLDYHFSMSSESSTPIFNQTDSEHINNLQALCNVLHLFCNFHPSQGFEYPSSYSRRHALHPTDQLTLHVLNPLEALAYEEADTLIQTMQPSYPKKAKSSYRTI